MSDPQKEQKEKKQRIMLIALFVGLLIAVLRQFAGGGDAGEEGAGDGTAYADLDLEALESTLYRSESQASRKDAILARRNALVQDLENIRKQHLPPHSNPFAWATDSINQAALSAGVQIKRISLINKDPIIPTIPANSPVQPAPPSFHPYQVSVRINCSYNAFKQFVRQLERGNPYVVLNSLAITGNKNDPENHVCEAVLEWPRDPAASGDAP